MFEAILASTVTIVPGSNRQTRSVQDPSGASPKKAPFYVIIGLSVPALSVALTFYADRGKVHIGRPNHSVFGTIPGTGWSGAPPVSCSKGMNDVTAE
jgi:hypothetical protein